MLDTKQRQAVIVGSESDSVFTNQTGANRELQRQSCKNLQCHDWPSAFGKQFFLDPITQLRFTTPAL
jgi:hypothetical protein